MKKVYIRNIFGVLTITLATSSLHAIFYQYDKYVDPKTGNAVHLFSDLHIAMKDLHFSNKQIDDFIKFVQKLGKNSLVITEDMKYLSSQLFESSEPFDLINRDQAMQYEPLNIIGITPLSATTFGCKWTGIDIINAECRLIYPLFDKETEQQALEKTKKEIASYNDDPRIKSFYQESLKKSDFPIGLEVLTTLKLLDAQIIHNLYQNRHRKNIVITAGGLHILNIRPVLKTLGYQLTATVSTQFNPTTTEVFESDINALFEKLSKQATQDQVKAIFEGIALNIENINKEIAQQKVRAKL